MSWKRHLIIYILLLGNVSAAMADTAKEHLLRGLHCVDEDDFPMAMHYFTRAMETAEQDGDIKTQMQATGYIGNVYYNLYDYNRALDYYTRDYEMATRMGDKQIQTNLLTNIVGVYCKLGDARHARQYFDLMLKATPKSNAKENFDYFTLYNQARLALVEGHPKQAIESHRQALAYAKEHKMDSTYVLYQQCELGQIYLSLGQADSAIFYGELCLKTPIKKRQRDFLTSVYLLLADSYGAQGDRQQEEHYRRLYFGLSDTLFNRKYVSTADSDLMAYESRRTDKQISSLHQTITRQLLVIAVAVVFLLVLAALLFLLYRSNRKLRHAHRTVLEKNRELATQEGKSNELLQQLVEQKASPDYHAPDYELSESSTAFEEPEKPETSDQPEPQNAPAPLDRDAANLLLSRIVRALDDTSLISQPEFSLQMLAETVGSNTRYVSWVINENYGKNFKTLLNEHRIRLACHHLTDREHYANVTIQAIYEEVGYTNAVSFIRAFRKFNGMTPSEYVKLTAS